ncbi:MAG: 2'-5' RNA ligase family protein [Lapillicoccus sp.]
MGEAAGARRSGRGVQSVELQLDEGGVALVVGLWHRLVEAGLPSQARHPSPTHRPHITLVAVSDLPKGADAALGGVVAGRLPVDGRWGKVTLFGAGPWTVVWRVSPSRAMAELQVRVASVCAVPADSLTAPQQWTAHVTLARRVGESDRPAVLDVLAEPVRAEVGRVLVAPAVRRWDAAHRREWVVGSARTPSAQA